MTRSARDVILARRARCIAAGLAVLGVAACSGESASPAPCLSTGGTGSLNDAGPDGAGGTAGQRDSGSSDASGD